MPCTPLTAEPSGAPFRLTAISCTHRDTETQRHRDTETRTQTQTHTLSLAAHPQEWSGRKGSGGRGGGRGGGGPRCRGPTTLSPRPPPATHSSTRVKLRENSGQSDES
eukprot:3252903-Rhodomonas_salina.1